jgi:hypothetical protein
VRGALARPGEQVSRAVTKAFEAVVDDESLSLINSRNLPLVGTTPLMFVPMYHGTIIGMTDDLVLIVQRVQTGVRMEKRLLKVLKAFAEYKDMTLGDLLEGIVLHAFDGKVPFSRDSLARIADLKKFYGLNLDSSASHRLQEIAESNAKRRTPRKVKSKRPQ